MFLVTVLLPWVQIATCHAAAVMLILLANTIPGEYMASSIPVFGLLGQRCFTIYLLHEPFLSYLNAAVRRGFPSWMSGEFVIQPVLILAAIAVPILVYVALRRAFGSRRAALLVG